MESDYNISDCEVALGMNLESSSNYVAMTIRGDHIGVVVVDDGAVVHLLLFSLYYFVRAASFEFYFLEMACFCSLMSYCR